MPILREEKYYGRKDNYYFNHRLITCFGYLRITLSANDQEGSFEADREIPGNPAGYFGRYLCSDFRRFRDWFIICIKKHRGNR